MNKYAHLSSNPFATPVYAIKGVFILVRLWNH